MIASACFSSESSSWNVSTPTAALVTLGSGCDGSATLSSKFTVGSSTASNDDDDLRCAWCIVHVRRRRRRRRHRINARVSITAHTDARKAGPHCSRTRGPARGRGSTTISAVFDEQAKTRHTHRCTLCTAILLKQRRCARQRLCTQHC